MVGGESSWLATPVYFPSTVSRIERDVRELSIIMLCDIAAVLSVDAGGLQETPTASRLEHRAQLAWCCDEILEASRFGEVDARTQIASLKRRAARASKTRVAPVQKAHLAVQAVHAPSPPWLMARCSHHGLAIAAGLAHCRRLRRRRARKPTSCRPCPQPPDQHGEAGIDA